jgi:hypothetical protein
VKWDRIRVFFANKDGVTQRVSTFRREQPRPTRLGNINCLSFTDDKTGDLHFVQNELVKKVTFEKQDLHFGTFEIVETKSASDFLDKS